VISEDTGIVVNGRHYTPETLKQTYGKPGPLSHRQQAVLDLIDGEHVLDIGCNLGYFVAHVHQRFPEKHILGVDYFQANVDAARILFPDKSLSFDVRSVYELDLEPASIDCVTFQATIEHQEKATQAIKQINRVIKPGGSLIVTTDNPYSPNLFLSFLRCELANILRRWRGLKSYLGPTIFNPDVEYARHVYCWTPSTLLTLLMVNGFEYDTHTYVSESTGFLERLLLRALPFFSHIQGLKVRKIAEAPETYV